MSLRNQSNILKYSSNNKRTFVVIPGLNHPKIVDLKKTKGLEYYEERMLFFLFLLKYPNTKIIYVTSKGFNDDLFAYYVGLISKDEVETVKRLKRLTHVEIDSDLKGISLAGKILSQKKYISIIKKHIIDPEVTYLRCYNPTDEESLLAKKLGVPLFGSKTKNAYYGTKSGCRKIFREAKIDMLDGFEDIKKINDLYSAIAKLVQKYPKSEKFVIKVNYSSSGKGNAVLSIDDLLEQSEINPKTDNVRKIKQAIAENIRSYLVYQNPDYNFDYFIQRFELTGGIVELFAPGVIVSSPSAQILVMRKGKYEIVSTHEQILGGPDGQLYLGCEFPANNGYREELIKCAKKIANKMAEKEVLGNFAIDFVVCDINGKSAIYPIEINYRKGGTTHPFRIAYYLTSSDYDSKKHILIDQEGLPICYHSMEFIESENYRVIEPMELIDIVRYSKISFNKKTNEGVVVYMPGMVSKFGRFGAICIAHTPQKAAEFYKKLVKLVDSYALEKSLNAANIKKVSK